MQKTRNIFYIITALYIIVSIIFIIARDNFFDRMGVLAYTNFLQFWLILGVIFLIIVVVLSQFQIRSLQNQNKFLTGEVTKIKSILYDIEHKKVDGIDGDKSKNELKGPPQLDDDDDQVI